MKMKTTFIIAALIAIALIGAKFTDSDSNSTDNGGFTSKDPQKAEKTVLDQLPKNNPVIR